MELHGGIFEIKAHSGLRQNITPCALETWTASEFSELTLECERGCCTL